MASAVGFQPIDEGSIPFTRSNKERTIEMFEDGKGNRYKPEDVIFLDIDTPGPAQFLGYVSLESYKQTRCIEEFVRVRPIEGHNMESVEREGMSIFKGVKYRTP